MYVLFYLYLWVFVFFCYFLRNPAHSKTAREAERQDAIKRTAAGDRHETLYGFLIFNVRN